MEITSLWPLFLLSIIPIIILLYILKRKYREVQFSSLMLWKEAYKNTQANTPWEKLKVNIMMIIQIILFLLCIFALMKPFLNFGAVKYKNLIVVIDNTASMSTINEDGSSRLEEAKEIARDYEKSISYDVNKNIIEYCGNSNYKIKSSIDDISQKYGSGDIEEIVPYVKSLGEGLDGYEALIISDKSVNVQGMNGKSISLGNSGENAAVLNVSHKDIEGKIAVIATIANKGNTEYSGDFSIYDEDELLKVSELNIKKGETVTLNYTLDGVKGKFIKGELSKKDCVEKDNVYYDPIKKNEVKKIMLVTDQNIFLEKALNNLENTELFKTNSIENISGDEYDLYVFDNVTPQVLPSGKGNILFINPESNELFNVQDIDDAKRIFGEEDVLSKYASNLEFVVSKYKNISIPYYGKAILKSGDDIVGFIGENEGKKIAAIGFDIHNSDIALKKEFPIFMYELGNKLVQSGAIYKNTYIGGETIEIKGVSENEGMKLVFPSGKTETVLAASKVDSLNELGVYKLKGNKNDEKLLEEDFVVNFPSNTESNIEVENLVENSSDSFENNILKKGISVVPFILLLVLIGLITEYILYLKGN